MSPRQWPLRGWLIGVLVFSVALNLLLIGFFWGSEQRLRGDRGMAPPHSQIGRFVSTLDTQRRAELAPLIRDYRHTGRRSMRWLRQARHALNEALIQEPLDIAAVTAAMTAVDQALLANSQNSQQAMLPLIQALSPAERQVLAASGRRMRGRHPRAPD